MCSSSVYQSCRDSSQTVNQIVYSAGIGSIDWTIFRWYAIFLEIHNDDYMYGQGTNIMVHGDPRHAYLGASHYVRLARETSHPFSN